ncbi:hypothetical protein AALO_G00172810 [Alosa alosa]|uniref:Uncharacterized protein n=1 Tax=Alosa alosa TaxID=278164 RepID=A0AAV6G6T2_9TELE|nr:hypothetical protein AALO_G00172810 [Alosa alosa]
MQRNRFHARILAYISAYPSCNRMITTGQIVVSIFTAFLLYDISLLSAAPVTLPLSCEGKVQQDGLFGFELPLLVTDLLKDPSCEVQLIIENIVRAIYEKGGVPGRVSSPVLRATMHSFTLSSCPSSVLLDVDCEAKLSRKLQCFCTYSTRTIPNITSFATSLTTALQTNKTSSDDPVATGPIIAIGIAITGFLIISALVVLYRKKIIALYRVFMEWKNRSTSARSSTEDLSGEEKEKLESFPHV